VFLLEQIEASSDRQTYRERPSRRCDLSSEQSQRSHQRKVMICLTWRSPVFPFIMPVSSFCVREREENSCFQVYLAVSPTYHREPLWISLYEKFPFGFKAVEVLQGQVLKHFYPAEMLAPSSSWNSSHLGLKLNFSHHTLWDRGRHDQVREEKRASLAPCVHHF
jgi:hypothetical protein